MNFLTLCRCTSFLWRCLSHSQTFSLSLSPFLCALSYFNFSAFVLLFPSNAAKVSRVASPPVKLSRIVASCNHKERIYRSLNLIYLLA